MTCVNVVEEDHLDLVHLELDGLVMGIVPLNGHVPSFDWVSTHGNFGSLKGLSGAVAKLKPNKLNVGNIIFTTQYYYMGYHILHCHCQGIRQKLLTNY